jgi:hypothetical protein
MAKAVVSSRTGEFRRAPNGEGRGGKFSAGSVNKIQFPKVSEKKKRGDRSAAIAEDIH